MTKIPDIEVLKKRSIELHCLYQVQEILRDPDLSLDKLCPKIIDIIPPAMQFPELSNVVIKIGDKIFQSLDYLDTNWFIRSDISCHNVQIGYISVNYQQNPTATANNPFLSEEIRLIQAIANSLCQFIVLQNDKNTMSTIKQNDPLNSSPEHEQSDVILEMLKQTNQDLYFRISRKLLYELSQGGNVEARRLLESISSHLQTSEIQNTSEDNIVDHEHSLAYLSNYSKFVYEIARKYFDDKEILKHINNWIQEDKLGTLSHIINRNLPLADVDDAMRRYFSMSPQYLDSSQPSNLGIKISLIRRFLSKNTEYINIAKELLRIKDFLDILEYVIYCDKSRGRLGGKSARIFLTDKIIDRGKTENNLLDCIKIPKTRFITTDVIIHFMHYNNFDDIFEQKYKRSNQIKVEYPYFIHLFKNGHFPEDISKNLMTVLDDFNDFPLIVRSSSLLDDRTDISFSGLYRSTFLSNQGTKQERLKALMHAIAEVYASTFAPEPIEYRVKKGLLDYDEEMGIVIQEVVGARYDKYFFPIYSGEAYSDYDNDARSKQNTKNNLIRMTFGLGTRIDNLPKDENIIQFSPINSKNIPMAADTDIDFHPPKVADVINLKLNCFETVDLNVFLKKIGPSIPNIQNIVSIVRDNKISLLTEDNLDLDNLIVTFNGLFTKTPFLDTINAVLDKLKRTLKSPVEIKFASDGKYIYLTNCRCRSKSPIK